MVAVKAAAKILRIGKINHKLNANNRLNAHFGHFFRKFQRPEQIVGVGNGKGWLVIRLRQFGEPVDGQRALTQRIGAVHMQMDKTDIFRGVAVSAHLNHSI